MSIKSIGHGVVNTAERVPQAVIAAPKKAFHAPRRLVEFSHHVAQRTFYGTGERVPFLTKIPVIKKLFTPKVQPNGKPAASAVKPLTKTEIAVAMTATAAFMGIIAGSVVAVEKNFIDTKALYSKVFKL